MITRRTTSDDQHEPYHRRHRVSAAGVFFHRTRAGETHLSFKYDATLVELVKAFVPSYARRYDGTNKAWIIAAGCDIYATALAGQMRALGYGIHETSDAAVAVTAPRPAADPFVELLRTVGPARTDAVFKALTKVLHPDRPDTGDRALFEQLDSARRAVAA